jgi:hypothetical protein
MSLIKSAAAAAVVVFNNIASDVKGVKINKFPFRSSNGMCNK